MGITGDAKPPLTSAMPIVDPAPIPINQPARLQLLPVIVHAALDLRIAVIMTRERMQALQAEPAFKTPS